MRNLTLILLLVLNVKLIFAQENPVSHPKVGLCLSGGAAKGIAHVALLKAIDSLGIKIDYITGTSMGAIVGGLYAIGYSGKEIEEIANTSDWDFYLSNQTNWNDININEKWEYGRYMMEMPIRNWKVNLPSGLIEGQNLMNYLRKLTFRVANIRDFNHFKIPFKCMAADIVSGEAIVLDKGDLAMALRASMSIPSVFAPLDYGGDTLMVDGGVVHNFPVDVLCSMGAEFVIGSYTGTKLYGRNQLNSMAKLLYQTSSLHSSMTSETQMKLCNILLDMDIALQKANLKSADFSKSRRIVAIGDSVTLKVMPELTALAEKQQRYKTVLPTPYFADSSLAVKGGLYLAEAKQKQILEPSFFVKKVSIKGIEDTKQEAARQYLGIKENAKWSRAEIQEHIDVLYSSNLYKKVYFEIVGTEEDAELIIHTEPKTTHLIKFGLHYDNVLGSGIVVNYTARDVLGKNNRLIVAADVAESPKFRLHYKKQLHNGRWAFNINQVYESTKEPFLYQSQWLENYKRHQNQIAAFLSTPLSPSAEFGGGLLWNRLAHRPLYRATDKVYLNNGKLDSLIQLSIYRNITLSTHVFYRKNTLSNNFFPESGYALNINAKYGFYNVKYQEIKTFLQENNVSKFEKDTVLAAFFRASMNYEKLIPLSKKTVITTKIHAGTLLGDNYVKTGNLYAENFFLGGIEQRRSPNYIPFAGNYEGSLTFTSFATVQLGLQVQPINNLFIMPHSSILIGNNRTPIYSSGLTIGYRSALVPVLLSISKATNTNKWEPYFAIGYRF